MLSRITFRRYFKEKTLNISQNSRVDNESDHHNGGVKILPDLRFRNNNAWAGLLILPGGDTWLDSIPLFSRSERILGRHFLSQLSVEPRWFSSKWISGRSQAHSIDIDIESPLSNYSGEFSINTNLRPLMGTVTASALLRVILPMRF
jgi:hypothetical protein